MILDAARTHKTVIKASYFDKASEKIQKGSLSVAGSEPFVWEISNPDVKEAELSISFIDPIVLEDLHFGISVSAKIEYFFSHDGYSWEPFNHYTYQITPSGYEFLAEDGRQADNNVLNTFKNRLIRIEKRVITSPARVIQTFTVFNAITHKVERITEEQYQILAAYLFGSLANEGVLELTPVFSVFNENTKEDIPIYSDLWISHVKIKISNFEVSPQPMQLLFISLPTKVVINIEDTSLTAYTNNLYKQKFYEEYTFFPSIANSFFEMMESMELDTGKHIPDITIDFHINDDGEMVIDITPPLELGSYFEPAFVWTILYNGKSKRFVYQSLETITNEVNDFLYNLPNNTSLNIEFTIMTTQFSISKKKTIVYNKV